MPPQRGHPAIAAIVPNRDKHVPSPRLLDVAVTGTVRVERGATLFPVRGRTELVAEADELGHATVTFGQARRRSVAYRSPFAVRIRPRSSAGDRASVERPMRSSIAFLFGSPSSRAQGQNALHE